MAVTASNSKFNQAPDKIKFKIFKMITKSLQKLANGVAGGKKKAAGKGKDCDGCCSLTTTVIPVKTVRRLKSGSKRAINRNRTRRGQIKIKMFKMIAKSLKDLSIRVVGGKNKAAGNRRCNRGCFSSPATVFPVVIGGEFKSASEGEIKQHNPKRAQIKIKNWKTIAGTVIQVLGSGGKKKASGGDGVYLDCRNCFNGNNR